MSVPAVDLDLAALLAPVSPDQPAGVDLRNSPEFKALFASVKDAFDNAAHAEEDADKAKDPHLEPHEREYFTQHLQAPDWDAVRTQAVEILNHRSKDLRVAAWLVESLVRTDGADGLLFGLRLLRELCAAFWGQIHERPDASGLTTTVAPIAKLGRRVFLTTIRSVPLVDSPSNGPLSARDYRASQNLEAVADPEERRQKIEQGVLPLVEFEAAAREVPVADWSRVQKPSRPQRPNSTNCSAGSGSGAIALPLRSTGLPKQFAIAGKSLSSWHPPNCPAHRTPLLPRRMLQGVRRVYPAPLRAAGRPSKPYAAWPSSFATRNLNRRCVGNSNVSCVWAS